MFPICTSALSHMVCLKFNSHVYKLKRWNLMEHICFFFFFLQLGVQRGASIWGMPNVQKNCWWANQYSSFLIKEKKLWTPSHDLMDMNHTKSSSSREVKERMPKWGPIGNSLGNMSGTWEPPFPPPPSLHWKLSVHCPSGKWTVHSPHQTQLEKNLPTPSNFSLVAMKFYS
jgi:hypothetical protein